MQRTVLMNPGPVNVTDKVRDAQLRGDLCHREPEFSELMGLIRKKLATAFGIEQEYTATLITGSGTAALEMAVSSCLSPKRSMLVIQNGVYGERIGKMAEVYRMDKHTLNYAWGEPPRLEEIEDALKSHPAIEVIALVHHETTTGLLNPLPEISALARQYDKRLAVDCISSLGGDAIDFEQCPIDFAVGTANKCIHGLPGVSFVLHRKKDMNRLKNIPARSVYFNLAGHHHAQEQGDTLFTPAVQAHYAFDAALDELIEETVERRIERYRRAAERLRGGFKEIGLEFLIPEGRRSNCLTALKLPDGVSYPWLHDRLKENGFVIYAGQGLFNNKIFRVANMGDIRDEEFARF
ncbi:MAG: alanine--glyoxylate aminotransferase family protein [Nitrospinae bacterium]|nr:alanine--glyoxylate aminotransferase family protein [Nitrospinota bacterium]